MLAWMERLRGSVAALRRRGRPRFAEAARGALAAVVAYLLALLVSDNYQPLVAPLTALLVVEVTLYGTLQLALIRVASVVSGVLLAIAFSHTLGFSWWSLGLLIAVSLFVGSALRLGQHIAEVPISGMLVLAVGGSESYGTWRVAETLIGAAVGIVVNGVYASRVRIEPAGAGVERLAGDLADLLDRIAAELEAPDARERARGWLERAREVDQQVAQVDRDLVQIEHSVWLNPRARAVSAATPALREALDTLERAAVHVRVLARALGELLRGDTSEEAAQSRLALAAQLQALATLTRTYGQASHDAAHVASPLTESRLVSAAEEAARRRERVAEALLAETTVVPQLWQVYGALLTHLDRVLEELDPRDGARSRRRDPVGRSRLLPPPAAGVAAEAAASMTRLRREAPQTVQRLRREAPRPVRRPSREAPQSAQPRLRWRWRRRYRPGETDGSPG